MEDVIIAPEAVTICVRCYNHMTFARTRAQECWHGRSCKPLPLLPGCTGADCRTARGKSPGVLTGPSRQSHSSPP